MRLRVDLGPEAVPGDRTTVVISPDGTRIAFPARGPDGKQLLATRLLNQSQNVLLAGTDGGVDPFFSPDGQWIGFFADSKMKKVSVQGGAVITLCDVASGAAGAGARGASWGEDGTIIVTIGANPGYGLSRVPETGGTPQPLTKPGDEGEATHRWPQALPGGRFVLFTGHTVIADYDNANIEILSLKTGKIKTVVRGGHFGRYLPGGYLVYLLKGTLFGVRFDLDRLEAHGTPVPLIDQITGSTGSGQFDFSRTGTFEYLPGNPSLVIALLANDNKVEPLSASQGSNPRLSPDGKRLTFNTGTIQIYDLERGSSAHVPFTGTGGEGPVWARDGKHIVVGSQLATGWALEWMRSDGAGEPHRLLESRNDLRPYSFSPDGNRLEFEEVDPQTLGDLWALPLDTSDSDHPKPGKPEPLLRTRFDEREPAVSPDGRWMAYISNESGQFQVYVRPVTSTGSLGTEKWQVSTVNGVHPLWSKWELFFYSAMPPNGRVMAAAYSVKGASFIAAKPYLWSNVQVANTNASWNFDVSPDGKRIAAVMNGNSSQEGSLHVTFLLNFFDEVRRRIP